MDRIFTEGYATLSWGMNVSGVKDSYKDADAEKVNGLPHGITALKDEYVDCHKVTRLFEFWGGRLCAVVEKHTDITEEDRDKLLVSFVLGYKIPYSIVQGYPVDRCYRWTFEESSIEMSIVELYPASKKWKVNIDYYCSKAADVLQKNIGAK